MDSGPSKVNVPNSHPSNPIHKEAMKAQGIGGQKKKKKRGNNKQADPAPSEQAAPLPNKEATPKHNTNKIISVVVAVGVAGLLVFSFSRKS